MYFTIEEYYKNVDLGSLTASEIKEVNKVRDEINSFRDVRGQVKYIESRRLSSRNRRFDEKVFGIQFNANLERYYTNGSMDNQYNKDWNGREEARLPIESLSKISQIKSSLAAAKSSIAAAAKPILVVLLIFLVLNIVIFISGLIGSLDGTPFDFCKDGQSTSYIGNRVLKEKDGRKIPVDYMVAGRGYTGRGWTGDDNLRGIGNFASEDFLFGGDDPIFSLENYAIASRWEYVEYTVKENMWPAHANYGNGTSDGVDTSVPYTGVDNAYYSWILKQKILVLNPDNGKAVVVMVGNGVDNPNWGGSPLNSIAGLTYKAQEALGFKAGGLDGGDYDTNVRDSGIDLEMWWVDENAPLGPVDMSNMSNSNQCGAISSVGGGNSSIADAAVSLAHENMAIAVPNSGPNNGNGTDLYVKVHDLVLPGDPWYQSCDRFAATAVRWSGADDSFPAGATGNIMEYLESSDKWVEIDAKAERDLMPGDLIIEVGHIIVYAGEEAVKKKFPNSTGTLAHASIGSATSPEQQTSSHITNNRAGAIGGWYDMGLYANGGTFKVFRNIKQEENSIYKNIDI